MMQNNLHKSGVYKITNLVNGRIYVGSAAKGFLKRWQKHKSDLNRNVHRNDRLQKAYNKYGPEAFQYEIFACCPPEYVLRLEQFFIDTLNPFYNICKTAGSSLGVKRTDEYKKKISNAKKGHKQSPEVIEKRRVALMGNTFTLGRKIPAEEIERRRLKQIGSKRSIETRTKISLANKGRIKSESTRAKIAAARMKYIFSIQNIRTGEVIEVNNLKQFAIDNNLHDGHLHETLVGFNGAGKQINQHKGFKVIQKVLAK